MFKLHNKAPKLSVHVVLPCECDCIRLCIYILECLYMCVFVVRMLMPHTKRNRVKGVKRQTEEKG